MTYFSVESKNCKRYLDIASNGNGEEKSLLTIEAICRINNSTLDSAGPIHTVEIGPGGGSAFLSIAKAIDENIIRNEHPLHITALELEGIESEALKQARTELDQRLNVTTNFRVGNAVNLDELFGVNSLDIVSTSALLHEVYSYSNGYEGIDDVISGISVSLRPGGFYAYRDVFGTEELSLHDRTRHVYDRSSWVAFNKLFLEHYLKQATHPYHRYDDRIRTTQAGKNIKIKDIDESSSLSIEAPVGVLREIQRHYITLRDHLWRTGVLGVIPILEGDSADDWIDKKRGHKRIYYKMLEDDPILSSVSTHISTNMYAVDGDVFNSTADTLMSEFLKDIIDNGNTSSNWGTWYEWLNREGGETYCYMSLNDFLGNVALRSFEATEGKSIIVPTREDDVMFAPRAYYDRYLKSKLSNPLPDGKQMILFESIPLSSGSSGRVERELITSKLSGALGALSVHCSQSVLSKIYTPLRKALQ